MASSTETVITTVSGLRLGLTIEQGTFPWTDVRSCLFFNLHVNLCDGYEVWILMPHHCYNWYINRAPVYLQHCATMSRKLDSYNGWKAYKLTFDCIFFFFTFFVNYMIFWWFFLYNNHLKIVVCHSTSLYKVNSEPVCPFQSSRHDTSFDVMLLPSPKTPSFHWDKHF